jgi:hypothetical protein
MSYPDRIVVYLKAPHDGPAKIAVLTSTEKNKLVTAENFTDLKPLASTDQVGFTLSIPTGKGNIDWLASGWKAGCRVAPTILLGDRGDKLADLRGIKYENTNALPGRALVCTFHGTGMLSCRDDQGVTLLFDLAKDAEFGVCLTLTLNTVGTAGVTFDHNFLPAQALQ